MKKQLTKSQIEEKKLKRSKLIKVALIVSAIFNLFFIIIAIIGCSGVKMTSAANNDLSLLASKQLKQKNNVARSDLDYYNGSFGYGLKYSDELIAPSRISKSTIATYSVSLGSNTSIVVRTSNDSVKGLDETWTCIYNIHSPVQSSDYIRFETINWTRTYTVDISNDTWTISLYSPEDYTYDAIYLPPSLGYNAENYQVFRVLMDTYFKKLPYDDYELSSNWSIFDYLEGQCYILSSNELNGYKVNNAIFGQSLPVLSNTLFSVNGALYTDLLFHIQSLSDPDIFNYVYSYSNPQESRPVGTVYFPDFAYAYNSTSERYVKIWSVPYEEQAGNVFHVYSFERGILNERLQNIRLFDRHLSTSVLPGYTNSNSLLANGVLVGAGYQNEDLQNAFDIITMAFSALTPLFSITILPGITIGILFFIPLIAIIVFAVIKIIHK